jgi:hypothetical protein
MNRTYEVIYNVGMLDDLHNYFPALLYEHNRFQTVPQIFQYIRQQMNTRFNLYSYGAGLAQEGRQNVDVNMPTVILTPQMAPQAAPLPRNRPVAPQTEDVFTNIQAASLLLGLLGGGTDLTPAARGGIIRQQGEADIWAQFRQPVVVRPSAAIIASATERLSGSDLAAGTACAICQDTIAANATVRRLRPCQHSYHIGCIDQWFERSVFCPTCRHDIRTPHAEPR